MTAPYREIKIRYMSDLHFEFHQDVGKSFLKSLPEGDEDLVVIAGDLCDNTTLEESLNNLSNRFKNAQVLYVNGNHEAFHSSIEDTQKKIYSITRNLPNVSYLSRGYFELSNILPGDTRKVHGCSLWFEYDAATPNMNERFMADFRYIRNYRYEVMNHGRKDMKYLRDNVRPGDLVITHHMPSWSCVNTKYRGSPLNQFFVHDCSEVFSKNQPALVFSGHTHSSYDIFEMSTRLVCNPFGYFHPGKAPENPEFDTNLVITV